jgi:hypothetical protein
MRIISWSQPDASDFAPIYVSVYKAAASDFKLAIELEKQWTLQSCPMEDFADVFPPFHPSMKGFDSGHLITGETYTNVKQMLQRYKPYTTTASQVTKPFLDHNVDFTGKVMAVELICELYKYYRGGIRIRMMNKSTSVFGSVISNGASEYLSAAIMSSNGTKELSMECPYYSQSLFMPVQDSTGTYLVDEWRYAPYGVTVFYFKAVGDDFSLHWLTPPRPGVMEGNQTLATQGYAGYAAWV